ncbi:MAG TPA: pitrilysin family protein [Vicingus sp.]|nr:pitrilysin family protein [Vicingus sp.]
MRKILLSVAIFSVALVTQAQNKIEFEQYKLKNGLNVILHEDHSTPIVAVTVLYHVGSKNENPDRTGFAHFFEHLLFEGTENIKRGEYMKLVQSNGGILNANTSFDRTFYFEILPSNQTELGLWLESERMLHAIIDETGVETQREVVKEEYRQRYDNQPYGTFLPEMFKRGFEVHPYSWMPIGSLEHLNAAKIEEFRDFYKTYYVPNNATLSIAGDINKPQVKKWIEKYFAEIPVGTKPMNRPTVKEPIKNKEVRDTIYDNIQLPGVMMGYHTPAQGTPDSYAVSMLAQILSQGKSSRLQKSLVDEQQKTIFVGAFPFPTEDPGMALMFGITNMGVGIDELENAINLEVEKVQKELISEEEFQKLKNQIESDMVTANSKVEGIAENLANYFVYYGDANLINTEVERFLKVTREDIKRVANEYFRKDNRVVLHYLPKSQKPN